MHLLCRTGVAVVVTEQSVRLFSQPCVVHMQSKAGLFENLNSDLNNESD